MKQSSVWLSSGKNERKAIVPVRCAGHSAAALRHPESRTRHVSNWLTVPLLLLAWPVGLLTGNFPLAFAAFAGVYVAFRWLGNGFGPADGKIAVGLAEILPPALLPGLAIQTLTFLICRLCGRTGMRLPGVVGFLVGTIGVTMAMMVCVPRSP
jgi:hypothetical protein